MKPIKLTKIPDSERPTGIPHNILGYDEIILIDWRSEPLQDRDRFLCIAGGELSMFMDDDFMSAMPSYKAEVLEPGTVRRAFA